MDRPARRPRRHGETQREGQQAAHDDVGMRRRGRSPPRSGDRFVQFCFSFRALHFFLFDSSLRLNTRKGFVEVELCTRGFAEKSTHTNAEGCNSGGERCKQKMNN